MSNLYRSKGCKIHFSQSLSSSSKSESEHKPESGKMYELKSGFFGGGAGVSNCLQAHGQKRRNEKRVSKERTKQVKK